MKDKFGFSLLYLPGDQPVPVLPPVFQAVELPGHLVNYRGAAFEQLPGEIFINDLMPVELTREIGSQSERIREHFLSQMAVLLRQSARLGAQGVIVDFDVESCFHDLPRRRELIALLKRLGTDLWNHRLTLYLPVRFPLLPEAEGSTEQYLTFLHELMSSNVAIAINVHPHELAGCEFDLPKLLHWLQFDLRLIRFIYEPETGNRLVERLILPWRRLLREFHRETVPLMAVPLLTRPDILENELIVLREFFNSIPEILPQNKE